MYYRLVFQKNSKLNRLLKILLLIAGLICDLAAIIGILMAIFGMPKYLYFLTSLAWSVFFRVVALRLVYSVESKLQNDSLVISKVYPNKTKIVFKEKIGDFKIVPYNFEDINDFSQTLTKDNSRISNNIDKNKQIEINNAADNKMQNSNQDDTNISQNAQAANVINLLVKDYEKYLVIGKNVKVLCNLDKYIFAVALKGKEI